MRGRLSSALHGMAFPWLRDDGRPQGRPPQGPQARAPSPRAPSPRENSGSAACVPDDRRAIHFLIPASSCLGGQFRRQFASAECSPVRKGHRASAFCRRLGM